MKGSGIGPALGRLGRFVVALGMVSASFALAPPQSSAAALTMQDLRALVHKSGGTLVQTFPADNGVDTGVFAEIKSRYGLSFTWYDLTSGQAVPLPVQFGEVQVAQLLGWDDITFIDMGAATESNLWVFPSAVHCTRTNATTPFACTNEDAYFSVATPLFFGSKPHEELTAAVYTLDGVELAFGPERGDEMDFNADYRSIPPVTTGFSTRKHLFTLTFQNATVAPHLVVQKGGNIYVRKITVHKDGPNLVVGLLLAPQTAKFYIGHIETLQPLPFLELRFSQHNWNLY